MHGPSGPQHISVDTRSSQRIQDRIRFEDFASFLDQALAAAADLFAVLTTVGNVPPEMHPLLRHAGLLYSDFSGLHCRITQCC